MEQNSKVKCPKKDKDFKKYWNIFFPKLEKRNNFHTIHIKNLEILCQLYVDYDKMSDTLSQRGFSYMASGRYGEQQKTMPEALERDKVLSQILKFSKMLGVTLDSTEKEINKEEW